MHFTGERFIPNETDKQLEIEHKQRYLSVEPLVRGKVVLDAACGEGYGSYMLSRLAAQVYGIDLSSETIAEAQLKYRADNLKFRQGSVDCLEGIEDQSIDIVVSFETIEHVDEATQTKFLLEIKRVLKQDGMLIMSTPDKHWYTDMPKHHNPFHVKEFYKHEFFLFLNSHFPHVEFYYQKNEVVSVVGTGASNAGYRLLDGAETTLNEGKYIVAICSAQPLDNIQIHSVMTNPEVQYQKLVDRILSLQSEVEERNAHLKKLDEQIERSRNQLQTNAQEIAFKNELVQELLRTKEILAEELKDKKSLNDEHKDEIIRELSQTKEILSEELKEKNRLNDLILMIERLENEISAKNLLIEEGKQTQIELSAENQKSNDQIAMIQERLAHHEFQIQEQLSQKDTQIHNLNGHIEMLLEQERKLNNILASGGWKALKRYYKLRDAVVPANSKRKLFARMLKVALTEPGKIARNLNGSNIKKFLFYLKTERSGLLENRVENYLGRQSGAPSQEIEVKHHVDTSRRLIFPKVAKPDVSIIIPVYNQWHYTYGCLASILEHTNGIEYEIIVADDMSTDDTIKIGDIVENITVIRDGTNRGFLLNCNNAAQYANGKYIFFLNNDTNVQANWLSSLLTLVENDESIGMVGSKLVYPDGRLQEAGGIIWNDASGWNYGRLDDPELPQYNYVKEVDYISGAAIMIRTELWKEIGGFDERYVPAYFEDSDLAFEVRKHGYKVALQPQSIVVHFEGISHGTDTGAGIKSYQIQNRQKFIDKWRTELQQQFGNAQHVFQARDRSRAHRTMLVVDHYVPNVDKDAGSRTVFQYLKLFINMGFNVKFIGDNFYRQEPYTSMLQQMGIEVLYGNWHAKHIDEWLELNGKYIDVTYLNRPHISIKYIDKIRKYSNSKVIYYGHDLHFLRELREYQLTGNAALLQSSEEWKKIEFELMAKSDVSYYPSQVEVDEINKLFPTVKARAIPAYIYDSVEVELLDAQDFSNRRDLLFVGGFGHKPNVDAVLWFTDTVFPKIRARYPDMKLYVVGSNPPDEIRDLQSSSLIVTGFVSDEELARYYRECRLVVVPLRYGAGVKGKVVEAMFNGCPIVTTTVGSEGLKDIQGCLIEADSSNEFASEVIELYNNLEMLPIIAQRAIRYVQKHFTKTSVIEAIQEDLRMEVTS
ncbi:glycosyltransferase [Cohnella lubricantis]|uniref:Glycosyltransferase n=1 Tax=Cohnella lubricantis TaxID=2163172 RepID=A0A841TBD0_9BACL|nr:glycosyltransferase [Cohnella lubricantis]MBB6678773.1 glycosyltransferase [Cohnella lubricantis]MBP2117857.1 GT2 family glycosyltransferase/ubiquinone/menaquinone biosynthesis C-methylase UbiE [Cohnella lubricantis]